MKTPDDAIMATIDAVARFVDGSPMHCSKDIVGGTLSAALWQHSPKTRRFEGHECHILALSLRGDAHLEQIANGRSVWRGAAPGSIVLLRSAEYSDWLLDGSFEMLHVYLDSSRIPDGFGSAILDRPFRDPVLTQLGQAAAMALRDTDGENRYVAPLLETMQQCLIDRYFTQDRTPDFSHCGGLVGFAQRKVEGYIQDHLSSDIAVDQLANLIGLSTGHFTRAFRSSYGVSPHQFIIEKRIARATAMLRQSSMSITEIAQATGFSSASHFGAQFRKRLGISPVAFRRH